MESKIYSSDIESQKYKRIIENTIIESNRVLKSWRDTAKKGVTFDNYRSLIYGYLVKFIKHEFSYRSVFNIKDFNPTFNVQDDRVQSMALHNIYSASTTSYTRHLNELSEYMKNYDFKSFDSKQKFMNHQNDAIRESANKIFTKTDIDDYQLSTTIDINFDSIRNIKFNT